MSNIIKLSDETIRVEFALTQNDVVALREAGVLEDDVVSVPSLIELIQKDTFEKVKRQVLLFGVLSGIFSAAIAELIKHI